MITLDELNALMLWGSAFQKWQDPEVIFTIASHGNTYVEIGTRWGGSAIVAGLAGCEVHCIDPWEYKADKPLHLHSVPHDVRRNWDYAGLPQEKLFLYQQSHPPWPKIIEDRAFDIGMIDGAHNKEQVRLDWEGMKSKATKYILFHDASTNSEVELVFAEAASDSAWEIEELSLESQFGILRRCGLSS